MWTRDEFKYLTKKDQAWRTRKQEAIFIFVYLFKRKGFEQWYVIQFPQTDSDFLSDTTLPRQAPLSVRMTRRVSNLPKQIWLRPWWAWNLRSPKSLLPRRWLFQGWFRWGWLENLNERGMLLGWFFLGGHLMWQEWTTRGFRQISGKIQGEKHFPPLDWHLESWGVFGCRAPWCSWIICRRVWIWQKPWALSKRKRRLKPWLCYRSHGLKRHSWRLNAWIWIWIFFLKGIQ